ncbi:MAG: transglycosylase SLT domain-containing protein [Methylococcales bacterium]
MQFVLFLIVLLGAGCSNQSPKTIYSTEAVHHTSYDKNLRHKKLAWVKPVKKHNFNEHDLIWDRLLSLYALPEVDDPRVERELNWFLDHPDYIARVQQRAEPFLYQIINEIESQNIPGEMALLPIVESAFKPDAVSSASAAGLWQFMPATGKDFGLKQNWWYDGRNDIYTSTQAAATYLKDLSENFNGDWLLALASYNYGKGNIQKAIDRNALMGEPTDYWSLRSLPQETMHYVPKLLAIAKLFAHADEYNVPLHPIRNKAVFEVVDVGSPLYLNQAAAMANISPEHFLKLNPAFKQNATAPDGPHHLLIPVGQVGVFKENLDRIPVEEKEQLTYQIKNQYLDMLAAKRAAELERIARKEEAERLALKAQEERLALARAAQEEKRAQQERLARKKTEILLAKKHKKSIDARHDTYYAANKHDGFQKVAHELPVNSKWNDGASKNSLAAGQKLNFKNKPQLVASNSNRNPFQTIHYVVKKGESLTGVARKFNVSVTDIRKWNADKKAASLQAGQKLKVIIDANQPIT